jgi:hypothetical protein
VDLGWFDRLSPLRSALAFGFLSFNGIEVFRRIKKMVIGQYHDVVVI